MLINDYILQIEKLNACKAAVSDARNYQTSQELWTACERGDWMLWLIARTRGDTEKSLRKLTLAKARCAKLVLRLMKDERSRNAVAVAERLGLGQATREELAAACIEAAAAAADYIDAASCAAAAAVVAADITYVCTALAAAVCAADAFVCAADDDDKRKETLKQCADIVRAEYPEVDVLFVESD